MLKGNSDSWPNNFNGIIIFNNFNYETTVGDVSKAI